jgi:hypothetical protein
MTEIYGDLAQNAGFVARFSEALTYVWSYGTEAAMRRYLSA